MNESKHSIDELFRKGLENHSMEAPVHVWEKINSTRTPLYKLANGFKQNSRWYMSVFAGLTVLTTATIVFLGAGDTEAQTPLSANLETTIATTETIGLTGSEINNQQEISYNNNSSSTTVQNTILPPANPGSNYTAQNNKQASNNIKPVSNTNPISGNPVVLDGSFMDNNSLSTTPDENLLTERRQATSVEMMSTKNSGKFDFANEIDLVSLNKPSNGSKLADVNSGKRNKYAQLWSVEFAGSYDFIDKSISSSNNSYTDIRSKSERISSAYSIQGRVAYRVNGIFSLKTGINYSVVNEKLKFDQPYKYSTIEDRIDTVTVLDPTGGSHTYIDTVKATVEHTGYNNMNSSNQYTFIDIPLSLNYHLFESNKWNVQLGAGVLFNIKFAQKGMFIHPQTNEANTITGTNNPFVPKTNINLMFNAGLSYRLCHNIDLLIEPTVRFGTNTLHQNFGAKQVLTTYSLFTGIRYKF